MRTNLAFTDLVNSLLEITHFQAYLSEMKNIVKMHNNREINAQTFCENYENMKRKVANLASQYVKEHAIYFPKEQDIEVADNLLWYLLHFPVGVSSKSSKILNMCELPLKMMLPALGDVIARLFLEEYEKGRDYGPKIQEYYKLIVKTINWLDEILNPPIPKSASGVYQFWIEMASNEYFHRFALGTSAYFNMKMKLSLNEDTRKQQKYIKDLKKKDLTYKQRKSLEDKLIRLENRFKRFPPCWDVLIVPQTLMRFGLSEEHEPEQEIEVLCKEQFWKNVEDMMLTNLDVQGTFFRKEVDYKIFLSATEKHKTIWGKLDREQERIAVLETLDEDATLDQKEHILIESGIQVDFDNEVDKKRYLRQIIAKRQIERYAQGGLVRMRYCADNLNMLTDDRICMFIGYLAQSEDKYASDLIQAFIESIMTGTPICRMLPPERNKAKNKDKINKEKQEDSKKQITSAIPGLFTFLPTDSFLHCIPKKLYEPFMSKYKEFNQKHPDFSFSLNQTAYTGRARLIDIEGFTPIEVAYCCGSVIPGTRSSLYYIKPDENLVERLNNSNVIYIKELTMFAEKGLNGPLEVNNDTIQSSIMYLKQYLDTLTKSQYRANSRNNRWQEPMPHRISTLNSQVRDNIIDELSEKAVFAKTKLEQIKYVTASILFCIADVLLLRPCEIRRLKRNSMSFTDSVLFVIAKSNARYKEARSLPVPRILRMLLEKYKLYLEQPEIQFVIANNGFDKLFPDVEEALKTLRESMHEIDITYEPYDLRRTGATHLHTAMKAPFKLLQALMGHSQVGFEALGPFSRLSFIALRELVERYVESSGIARRIKVCSDNIGTLHGK